MILEMINMITYFEYGIVCRVYEQLEKVKDQEMGKERGKRELKKGLVFESWLIQNDWSITEYNDF